MTEGINKKDLLAINPWDYDNQQDLLNAILGLCTELDQWLPIDENPPKDKPLLLAYKLADGTWYKWAGFVNSCWNLPPTHYKLLPEDPK